jgi:hypothetical protein
MTPAKLAQRRAAKAQRRKAIARAKRKAEIDGRHVLIFSDEAFTPRPSMGKASAALLEVADPLLELARDPDEMEKALALALLAWNLSLLPEKERMERMAKVIEGIVPGVAEDAQVNREELFDAFREIIAVLISRKLQLFPLDDRHLVDVEVRQGRTRCYVTVATLLDAAA